MHDAGFDLRPLFPGCFHNSTVTRSMIVIKKHGKHIRSEGQDPGETPELLVHWSGVFVQGRLNSPSPGQGFKNIWGGERTPLVFLPNPEQVR